MKKTITSPISPAEFSALLDEYPELSCCPTAHRAAGSEKTRQRRQSRCWKDTTRTGAQYGVNCEGFVPRKKAKSTGWFYAQYRRIETNAPKNRRVRGTAPSSDRWKDTRESGARESA